MKRLPRQKGVAIVEFALILPMLLILTFIVTEMGRAVMNYNTMAKSVRDAARYLTFQTPNNPGPDAIAKAKNLVVYGNLEGTGSPLVDNLSLANVPDPTWQEVGATPVITMVTIQVQGYTFVPLVSNAFGVPLGPFTFSNIAASMRTHL